MFQIQISRENENKFFRLKSSLVNPSLSQIHNFGHLRAREIIIMDSKILDALVRLGDLT